MDAQNSWLISLFFLLVAHSIELVNFCKYLIMKTTQYYQEFSNKTAYGIESDAIRYTWAGCYLFILISSLIGDTTILIASIKYKAFKLHRVIIVVIQHIAFCDLILSTTAVLPNMFSVISDKWVLGNLFC